MSYTKLITSSKPRLYTLKYSFLYILKLKNSTCLMVVQRFEERGDIGDIALKNSTE